jgi:hypothetical protein
MAAFAVGVVGEILETRPDLVRVRVAFDERELEAVGFPSLLGPVGVGDSVVVNTTGVQLGLGTGDVGFVLWNLDGETPDELGSGHIMKLRYTPVQTNVLAAEEEASPHHESMREALSIEGTSVVACGLHSQVAGVAAGVKAAQPDARVGYLMSDAGALPLAWSRLVAALKGAGLVEITCTYGHAFGGDLEAVNVFSGLVALRRAAAVDVVVAALGPGIVGTATALGFSGIEQGQVLDAASALEGSAIACPRVSFADERDRHFGLSHHTTTALVVAARERCTVAVPTLPDVQAELVRAQLRDSGVAARHEIVEADGGPALALLAERGVRPRSMRRSIEEDSTPWLAAGAAGAIAAARLGRRVERPTP